MSRTPTRLRASAPMIAALLLTSALGACNGSGTPAAAPSDDGTAAVDATPQTLPLSTTGSTTQMVAPPVTALPAGRTIGLRRLANRQQGYGWLDRANYQEEAVQDAPPDYSFDQDGVQPWTWASGNGARVISEPVAGGYRTYYYEAGAEQPYLVRDPRYAYAYENGALVGVFTLAGVLIDPVAGSPQVSYGVRYFERGTALWRGARAAPHLAVNAYAWNDRRADLSAGRVAWQAHIADNPDWSAWNGTHAAEERSRWDTVRAQHQVAAQQFGNWQEQKYQGPPPQLYGAPDRAERSDHAAAVAGGVVAAGVAAAVAHHAMQQHADTVVQQPSVRQPGARPEWHRPAGAPDHGVAAPVMAPYGDQARMTQPDTAPPARHAPPHPIDHQPPQPRPQAFPQDHADRPDHAHGDPHRDQ